MWIEKHFSFSTDRFERQMSLKWETDTKAFWWNTTFTSAAIGFFRQHRLRLVCVRQSHTAGSVLKLCTSTLGHWSRRQWETNSCLRQSLDSAPVTRHLYRPLLFSLVGQKLKSTVAIPILSHLPFSPKASESDLPVPCFFCLFFIQPVNILSFWKTKKVKNHPSCS